VGGALIVAPPTCENGGSLPVAISHHRYAAQHIHIDIEISRGALISCRRTAGSAPPKAPRTSSKTMLIEHIQGPPGEPQEHSSVVVPTWKNL